MQIADVRARHRAALAAGDDAGAKRAYKALRLLAARFRAQFGDAGKDKPPARRRAERSWGSGDDGGLL